MEEIVIPNLDDDDDDFALPSINRAAFGGSGSNGSSSSLPDLEPYASGLAHRSNPSDGLPKFGGPSTTPQRPRLQQASASYSVGVPASGSGYGYDAERPERPRLGKFSNGSSSSIMTTGTSIGSTPGFLQTRKGSFASIKNALKGTGGTMPSPVPPVPAVDAKHQGYPALKNPFSRFEAPSSPVGAFFSSPRAGRTNSPAPSAYHGERKHSLATSHTSGRSFGGRSMTSQGSSNFRAEDHPLPSLPPIPSRQAPSRMGRHGSEAGSIFGMTSRRNGSIGGEDATEGRTPGEEAIRVVFRDFKEAANGKISKICARPLNTQPSLTAYLESSIDPALDSAITSLAHCAKRHARRVVDLLHTWCRSHCEGIGASEVRAHLDRSLGLQMRVEDAAAILTARKSCAAKFILNRALIEIVRITPREALGEELGMSLEQNAFNAYRTEKLEESAQSGMRRAVAQLQVELLGHLSTTRFLTVSDKFVLELQKHVSGAPTKESEARIEHLLKGVRHLKIRVYPEDELEMSAEFIQALANLFSAAHGQTLKTAYAECFISLLHPVVETATAEVNHPMWSKAMAVIFQRAQGMAVKPRYWVTAFPLVITALGVSPREVFMQHWQPCIDTILAKIKDRTLRAVAMNSLVRLLWVYLNRCAESSTSTRKRLDPLIRTLFAPYGALYPPELPLEPFVLILHYIMARQLDYGEDFISDFLRGTDGGPVDLTVADRATVLVRAIGYTLRTVEQDKSAPWPDSADFTRFSLDGFETSGEPLPEDIAAKDDVASLLARAGPAMVNLLFNCDRVVGPLLISNDAVSLSAHTSSNSIDSPDTVTRKNGDVHAAFPAKHEPILRLLTSVLDIVPRCLGKDVGFAQVANVLCRATCSADPGVCTAAAEAMRRATQDPTRCLLLVNTYRDFVFETRHVFRDTFIGSRLLESQFERVVKLWLDLLEWLVAHQRLAAAQGDTPDSISPVAEALIDKIEGAAMFLLCSTSLPLRKLALQVLAAARDLEGSQRKPSAAFRYSRISPDKTALTRVLQIFGGTPDEVDTVAMRALPWFTSGDRHRFDLATSTDRSKLLQRIAESDHAKDALLWLALLPWFVSRVCEQLPSPAVELRSIVTSVVLRLQGHVASTANAVATRAAPRPSIARTSSDGTVLAEHWRAYLTVLCVTMSPASASGVPATPPVQRTKEAIILTPDTIGGPGLFHYLGSLLGWEDPRFKDAAVYALGATGQSLLRPLSEVLLSIIRRLADGSKVGGTPSQTTRRNNVQGPLWTAVAHVFRLISPLLLDAKSASHLANLSSTIAFVKVTHTLLSDRAIKQDYDLQSLRRSFCVVVEDLTNALGKLDSSDRFLGEELRGAIFKLCYEWCHVGRRPDVAKARESQTLQAASEGYKGERDRAQYLDDLQAKTKLLSAAAAEAMAGLCQGKLISTEEATPAQQASDHLVEPLTVLRWIRGMFTSSSTSHHDIGRKALFALIRYNWSCSRLLDEVLHQSFGEGEQFSHESSFFGVVADILAEGHVQLPIEQVACLALSKLGHPVNDVRQRAFQLTLSLLGEPSTRLEVARLSPAVGSSAPNVYRQAQRTMADKLADMYAGDAIMFLGECTTRLSQLEAPRRLATLSILPPWLAHVVLSPEAELTSDEAAEEHQALSNLMYLAVRFSDDHLDEIRDIFLSFTGSGLSKNITALVKFLFEQGGKRRSPEFVSHAQRVMACLAQSPAGDTIFDEICNFIEPGAMVVVPESEVPPSPMTSLANLDSLMSAPSARSQAFSTGQLALLFAGELLPHWIQDIELGKRLPTLLHVAMAHCDHAASSLREQSQAVLFQIIRAWICDTSNVPPRDAAAMWTTAEAKATSLSRTRNTAFWKAEDSGTAESAFFAPSQMTALIMKILGILLPLQPRIRQHWGELALTWATSCPIRHLACRSFQVFRILSPKVSPRMISDTLARLSSTMASSSPEIQTFNLEVLRTFGSIIQSLGATEAASYPQIFWCSIACLTTPYEEEFVEVIELLSHVLDKTNLSDPIVVQHLVSFRPPDWVGPPPHLQSLLLVGLRSSKTALMTFDLLRRLTSASHDELIDDPADRLLHGFIAALPWMLHSTDIGEPNEELAEMALDLAAIADAQSNAGFSRLLTSFARARFRSKDDFIRQAASLLRDCMSTHALDIVTLLLGFTLNSHDWMREKSMQVLQLILQSPEVRAPLVAHGTELLQPLLRLLSTKHAAQALDVLDMPAATAASAEAMTSSMLATGEIFGPISESGWSVPKAKEMSALTRENVTAVFNTCAIETRAASAHFSVVQFSDVRAFPFPNGNANGNTSQVSLDLVSEVPSPPVSALTLAMSTDNASMGDLVGALHSLGQFFDDGLDGGSPRIGKTSGHGRMPSETLSDRRVRAIMARGRNPSISSPIYEHHPMGFANGRRHQHTTSELTDASAVSSTDEPDPTQRMPYANGFASPSTSSLGHQPPHMPLAPISTPTTQSAHQQSQAQAQGSAYQNGTPNGPSGGGYGYSHPYGQAYGNSYGPGNGTSTASGYSYSYPYGHPSGRHQPGASVSSMSAASAVSDADPDRSENVFGLDEVNESVVSINLGGMDGASAREPDSEQNTPVMIRRGMQWGGVEGMSGSPSPRAG